jgi:hypothetical protein
LPFRLRFIALAESCGELHDYDFSLPTADDKMCVPRATVEQTPNSEGFRASLASANTL